MKKALNSSLQEVQESVSAQHTSLLCHTCVGRQLVQEAMGSILPVGCLLTGLMHLQNHDASSSGATEAKAAGLKSASAPADGQQDAHRDGEGHEGGAFWDRQSWPSPTKLREGHVA